MTEQYEQLKNARIFITGGAGFIATKLIERLVDDNEIVVLDNFTRNTLEHTPYWNHKNLTVKRGDVRDFNAVKEAMAGCDHVVHAAAIAGIDSVVRSPITTMEVNMMGTATVLKAAHETGGIKRIIEFSTSEIYGSHAFQVDESAEAAVGSVGEARWTYAVSKLGGEHFAHAYHAEHGLPTVTVRPFNVYGPGQTGEGALMIFIRKALRNEDIFIFGDGSQIRAWCYVDDMVNGVLCGLTHPNAVGESFNIGNARTAVTIYNLAETVIRLAGASSKLIDKPPLSADIQLRIPQTSKAKDLIGFEAQVGLEEGIRRTLDWVKSDGSVLPDIKPGF